MAPLFSNILVPLLLSGTAFVHAQLVCPPGYAPLPAIPGSICFGPMPSSLSVSPTSTPTVTVTTTNVLFSPSSTRTSTVSSAPIPTGTSAIDWVTCPYNVDYTLLCAYITVPLDYTLTTGVVKRQDDASTTLQLQLVRAVAPSSNPRNQSILTNPGGPGSSGIEDLILSAKDYWTKVGDDYDLISFDPRGTSNTIPFQCATSLPTQEKSKRSLPRRLKGLGRRQSSDEIAFLRSQTASRSLSNAQCVQQDGTGHNQQYLDLMGTAFVARDMLEIVKALNEDGLLRYFGSSYGTLLGATFAGMFPDRVGRMVLDGVVNPVDYYTGYMSSAYKASDAAFNGFFSSCAAAPDNCAIASGSMTGPQLFAQFQTFMANFTSVPGPSGPITGSDDVMNVVFNCLYNVGLFRPLATFIQQLYDGQVTKFPTLDEDTDTNPTRLLKDKRNFDSQLANRQASATFPIPTKTPGAIRAISGGETLLYPNGVSDSDLQAWYAAYSAVTSTFLQDTITSNVMSFATWPVRAKEVYQGSFNVNTQTPILFVGNTYDPVTPYQSAQFAQSVFPGSSLIHQDSFGHCSGGQPSSCTAQNMLAYFQDGTLPAYGTFCSPDHPPFTTISQKRELWARQGLSASEIDKREVWNDPRRRIKGARIEEAVL